MNRADALAESLLESGIDGDENLAVRSCSPGKQRPLYLRRPDEKSDRAVREDSEGGRRSHGHHGGVSLVVESSRGEEDCAGARALCADVVRGSDPHEFAAGARRICAFDRRVGLRERDAGLALALQGLAGKGRAPRRDGRLVLDGRTHGRAKDRVIGGNLASPVCAA